ncbi:MAG: polyprenyl synthetase family protein [Hyphomicrobiales bacterium]|nr:polyprenyl synthetase family protein [Hyphomicrobiales bacterium]
MKLEEKLQEISDLINERMDDLLPSISEGVKGERRIAEAMRYTAMSGGKRLRPFLVVASADLFGVSRSSSLQVAAAVEFLHAYSLIHDDLPSMDNDDMRRGQPSSHIKFDEATAILAGDALLTLVFEVISHPTTHSDAIVRSDLVQTIAQAGGTHGLIGGQMMDMLSEGQELPLPEISRLQRMKTGALFALSCELGAIMGKASRHCRNALRGFANDVGLAFQIADDLMDAEGLSSKAGKKTGKDALAGKATFVTALGIEKAKKQAQMLVEQAGKHLDVFDHRADVLREFASFVVNRQR